MSPKYHSEVRIHIYFHTLLPESGKSDTIQESNQASGVLVQEPAIGLFKWFRPKGLKVCSYVEKVC